MSKQQRNMQRRDNEIASLSMDEDITHQEDTITEDDDSGVKPVVDLSIDDHNRDTYYDEILAQLKRGVPQQTIENQLVSKGISRTQARELTKRVYAENSDERKYNVYVLYGTGFVCAAIGILFIILSIINGNGIPIVSPTWVLIGLGAYFAWRGYQDYKAI